MFEKLWKILTDPSNEIRGLKAKDMGEGAKAVAYGAIVTAIGSAVISFFTTSLAPFMGGPGAAVMSAVSAFIGAFIGWIVGGVIVYIIAMVLGSKTGFSEVLANYGYLSGALLLVTWIPIIGFLAAIYGLYLLYLFFQYVTGLKKDKALLGVAIIVVLWLIVGAIAAAVTYMWVSSMTGAPYGMYKPY